MTQWVMVFAAKLNDLSLIHGPHCGGRKPTAKGLFSECHMCVHTCTQNKLLQKKFQTQIYTSVIVMLRRWRWADASSSLALQSSSVEKLQAQLKDCLKTKGESNFKTFSVHLKQSGSFSHFFRNTTQYTDHTCVLTVISTSLGWNKTQQSWSIPGAELQPVIQNYSNIHYYSIKALQLIRSLAVL